METLEGPERSIAERMGKGMGPREFPVAEVEELVRLVIENYPPGGTRRRDADAERLVSLARYPRCLAGARACPPEDVGGTSGYEDFLAVIADPEHEEHEDMLRWTGGSFDPGAFSAERVCFDDPRRRWRLACARG